MSISTAYDAAAEAWSAGPDLLYAQLAQALVGASPVPVDGSRVLDIGAGTGSAARAAVQAGAARVVAADIAAAMLRRCGPPPRSVIADAARLPFRTASFDLVLAAFCLNHVPDPATVLAQARRVSPAIAASTFAPGWTHPAKPAVDAVLRAFGYRAPLWYLTIKRETEPLAADPELIGRLVAGAGFRDVEVRVLAVPTGLSSPAMLASWRLGMAHVAPFVAELSESRQAELRSAAEQAVSGMDPPVVEMSVLTGR